MSRLGFRGFRVARDPVRVPPRDLPEGFRGLGLFRFFYYYFFFFFWGGGGGFIGLQGFKIWFQGLGLQGFRLGQWNASSLHPGLASTRIRLIGLN